MLAPLKVGDRLPWKLDSHGTPLWLTVREVIGDGLYAVEYPDGSRETIHDSE